MSTRNTLFSILVLAALMVGIGVYSYPRMPDVVAIHWNAQGIASGSYWVRMQAGEVSRTQAVVLVK